ncbi:MAG: iron donor protein CyaY [Proteobacteria bacterium]|nr:iron donor protein CyaY [Pseudomonadota bacterium]MCL2308625.1 iron donor protein CyaY [Pseudomonadota bacterium]
MSPPLPPFPEAADRFLDALEQAFETLADDHDLDWQRSNGILTLDIGDRQWVINTHAPREELWFAGPGGAHHFQRDAQGVWRDTRSDATFAAVLTETLRSAGMAVLPTLPE